MKRVVLLEEAVLDLEEARVFYERLEVGIGDYCVSRLLEALTQLETIHGVHTRHFGCFRALVRRFPFGIYYLNEAEAIRVVAILDLRRSPSWIHTEMDRRRAD